MFSYDVCVVGAGLIGAAAAKYLSSNNSLKVCLIGPEEPRKSADIKNRDIYGQHYDEGRITRKLGICPIWTKLAERSINQYRDIERKSGITFNNEVGYMCVAKKGSVEIIDNRSTATTCLLHVDEIQNNDALQRRFPYLNFGENDCGLLETDGAGHISARKMLAAQTIIASNSGCDVLRAIVRSIDKVNHTDGSVCMQLTTDDGAVIHSRKVLLSTGAFTASRNLLPPGIDLDYQHVAVLVTLVEISEEDAVQLRSMPTISYRGDGADDWEVNRSKGGNSVIGFYLLPPILYPDGKYYLKIGYYSESLVEGPRMTGEDIQRWYTQKGNDPVRTVELKNLITSVVKDIKPLSYHPDSCVMVTTPTGLPYIGMIHSNLGIVLGDNGAAAKSSDEIGRIASRLMMTGQWDYDIPRSVFELKYKSTASSRL